MVCVQSFQIKCGRAKSLAWLRADHHAHDQPFLAMSCSNNTSLINTHIGRATAQLQHVCGQLRHSHHPKYDVLYRVECFWFLRFEQD